MRPFLHDDAARARSGDAADFPIRFSTKYTDQESGLAYFGYRRHQRKKLAGKKEPKALPA